LFYIYSQDLGTALCTVVNMQHNDNTVTFVWFIAYFLYSSFQQNVCSLFTWCLLCCAAFLYCDVNSIYW